MPKNYVSGKQHVAELNINEFKLYDMQIKPAACAR